RSRKKDTGQALPRPVMKNSRPGAPCANRSHRPPAWPARHGRARPLFWVAMAGLEESLRATLGGKAAAKLDTAFGLTTTGDLLRHYPRRYGRRGELTDLASLRDGEQVTVFAQVENVRTRPMRARRGQLLEVTVTDGRARLAL